MESETHNMSCGVLGVLPAPAPAEESDGEERGPEEDVGGGEDVEDPHPGQPLALNLPADSLHLTRDHSQLRRVKLRVKKLLPDCCDNSVKQRDSIT